MAFDFKFPDVGEGITEGLLVKWRVKEGEEIKEDQVLAEVETDKAIVEVPSPKAGKVTKLHAKENETIRVGQVIVTLDGEPGAAAKKAPASPPIETKRAPTVVGAIAEELSFGPSPQAKAAASPTALTSRPAKAPPVMPRIRQLAKGLGVDVDQVQGTGPGGRILEADVQQHAAQTPRTSQGEAKAVPAVHLDLEKYGPVEREPFHGVRKSIAERLLKTTRGAPLVTHFDVADMTAIDAARKKHQATYMPFFIKAIVGALKAYPRINAALDEAKGEIAYLKYYNVGIAVDTENGLMVPVIKGADKKTLADIGKELAGIAERARDRKISLEEMRGGSFTISNVGAVGGLFATPIMNYPQSAILAIGKIREVPVVRNGKIGIGKEAPLSLTFDHRLIDGADAGRFVNKVVELLQSPEKLVS